MILQDFQTVQRYIHLFFASQMQSLTTWPHLLSNDELKKVGTILENKVHQKMKTLETVNYLLKLFISYDFRCAPAWESSKYIIYTWYWLIMGFLLPLVIIIYANFKTVQCLKKVGIITIIWKLFATFWYFFIFRYSSFLVFTITKHSLGTHIERIQWIFWRCLQ